MKIKLLATGQSPDFYTFDGEVVTAHKNNGISEEYDLSSFPEGGQFQGADTLDGIPAIRHVERTDGVLKVTLCQQVGPGHWSESDWLESTSYNPDNVYVKFDHGKAYSGLAWAKTRQGNVGV